jgi:hypothetical protein
MTAEQAKQLGFTHHGKIYGFPVYITDDEDMNIQGTNWFNDKMVAIFVWLDTTFEINECFALLKGEKL